MKILIFIIALIIVTILQTSVFPIFNIENGIANLLLVLILATCILDEFQSSLIICLSGGLILDIHSELFFGLITLSLLLTVFITHIVIKNLITDTSHFFSKLSIFLIGICFYFFLLISFSHLSHVFSSANPVITLNNDLFTKIFIGICINAILLFPVLKLFDSYLHFFTQYEKTKEIKM